MSESDQRKDELLRSRFDQGLLDDFGVEQLAKLKKAMIQVERVIDSTLVNSRERSSALSSLDVAFFWMRQAVYSECAIRKNIHRASDGLIDIDPRIMCIDQGGSK
jgi:hypothetical protein